MPKNQGKQASKFGLSDGDQIKQSKSEFDKDEKGDLPKKHDRHNSH